MMPSIGLGVTLPQDLFLLMLRYTTSNNTIYSFLVEMRIIPKVMPQIIEEFLLLLVCETRRQILSNDEISIINIP
jgi:hypothetical protein